MLVRFGRLIMILVFGVASITTAPVGGAARTVSGLARAIATQQGKEILRIVITKTF
jgi:hypothetical protein